MLLISPLLCSVYVAMKIISLPWHILNHIRSIKLLHNSCNAIYACNIMNFVSVLNVFLFCVWHGCHPQLVDRTLVWLKGMASMGSYRLMSSDKPNTVYCDGSCLRNGQDDAVAGIGIYWPLYCRQWVIEYVTSHMFIPFLVTSVKHLNCPPALQTTWQN